jgi:hypothetical protein
MCYITLDASAGRGIGFRGAASPEARDATRKH